MKFYKYLPELIIFLGSLGYLLIYILNDLRILSVPDWMISVDVTIIELVLLIVILIFRDMRKGN